MDVATKMDDTLRQDCDVCGSLHATEDCPELGLDSVGYPAPVTSRARLTLPGFLFAVDMGEEVGVFARDEVIPKKTQFGPFEAKKTTHEFNDESLFLLKVTTRDGAWISLDTTSENDSNWMCLVRAASTIGEQNCIAYQMGSYIFYSTTQEIPPATELKVWYAPAYAKRIGKSPIPDGQSKAHLPEGQGELMPWCGVCHPSGPSCSKVMLGMKVIYPSVEDLPDVQSLVPNVENSREYSEQLIEQDVEIPSFPCKHCSKGFYTESDLALHLREHILPGYQPLYKGQARRRGRPPKSLAKKKKRNFYTTKGAATEDSKGKPENGSDSEMDSVCDEGERDKSSDEEFEPVKVIFAEVVEEGRRVQPRRSLKGKRTSGFEADENFVSVKIKTEKLDDGYGSAQKKSTSGSPTKKIDSNFVEKKINEFHVPEKTTNDVSSIRSGGIEVTNSQEEPKVKRRRGRPRKYATQECPMEEKVKTPEYAGNCNDKAERFKDSMDKREVVEDINNEIKMDELSDSEKSEMKGDDPDTGKYIMTVNTNDIQVSSNNNERIMVPPAEAIANMDVDDALQGILDELDKSDNKENASVMGKIKDKKPVEDQNCSSETSGSSGERSQVKEAITSDAGTEIDNMSHVGEENNQKSCSTETRNEEVTLEEVLKDSPTMQLHEYVATFVDDTGEEDEDTNEQLDDTESSSLSAKKNGTLSEKELIQVDSSDSWNNHVAVENSSDGKQYICKLCGKKFLQEKYFRLHFPAHTGKFKCERCGMQYTRKDSLKRHECKVPLKSDSNESTSKSSEKVTQKGSGILTCDICSQEFCNEKYLFRHMAMHTDIYECKNCEKRFSRKDSLQRHVLKCSPDDAELYKIYICRKCQKTFATKLGRENHESNCQKVLCKVCKCVFDVQTTFEAHKCVILTEVEAVKGVIRYNCSDCPKSFRNLSYLNLHKQIHEGGNTCSLCGRKCRTKEDKEEHERICVALSIIQKEGHVQCDSCDEVFTNGKLYKEHYLSHSHPHHCEMCDKRFIKIGSLHSHVCSHNKEGAVFTCPVCLKCYRSERLLARHQEMHKEQKFVCKICNKKFYRRDYFSRHVCKAEDGTEMDVERNAEVRAQHERLVCHICGKNFVSSSNLNKHMKVHGEKTCVCHLCNKKFHYEEYLRIHIEGFHQKKYQYQCSECGKILTSKPGLISHMKQFHSNEKEVHPCPTCGKVFSQKGNMKTHMYSHTKERGFHCSYCSKAFKYPDQLNRHKLIHTMENKLQCDHCDKKFVKQYDLKKHYELFHSGMMYVCDICGSRCGHRHTMVRHYKRKHQEHFEQAKEPSYLDSLFKLVEKDTPVSNDQLIQDQLSPEEAEVVPITETLCTEEFVPQTAAEVLHSLSNSNVAADNSMIVADGTTVIQNADGTISMPGQEGTFNIQNIQQAVEGPDGQSTVVILQFVSQPDQEEMAEVVPEQVEIQQLETQVIKSGGLTEEGGEIETYIQQYVVSDQQLQETE